MRGAKTVAATLLLGSFLLGSGSPGADERPRLGGIDLHDIYQRLQPGMTVDEVARAADRRALATSTGPVTSWVIWNPPETGRPTTVLRAAFDDGRLVRVEYEAFGDEYRRLIKGGDLALTVSEDELRRLWRRDWRLTQAVEHCEEALEAFHQLTLAFQERLTTAEQAAWVHALGLRRAAERDLGALRR
jgi:hypothetical protein